MHLKTSWAETNLPNYTCLRQYHLFTIGVGPIEMFFSGIFFFYHLGSSLGSRCMLCSMVLIN